MHMSLFAVGETISHHRLVIFRLGMLCHYLDTKDGPRVLDKWLFGTWIYVFTM